MFSVKEYADEMQITVQEVLKTCEFLHINAKDANDILSEDDVIMLDNAIEVKEEVNTDENDDYNEIYDDIAEEEKIPEEKSYKPKKPKKKQFGDNKKNYEKKRKEMYKHKDKLKTVQETDENVVFYKEGMTVSDLADALSVSGNDIIVKLMNMGVMISLNQPIDFDTSQIVALEYGKTIKNEKQNDITNFEELDIVDDEKELEPRPAVVTIMGHVDHGKTTLLDYIRSSNIVSGEAGGITQHIGAYQITHNDKKITFIDTPGHAAFTRMRARGAEVTDIVVIIVAADDGVMPQTKEAIDHALSANVPIIVAINKIDKEDANLERIYTEMANYNITAEKWGGDIPFVEISAKTGKNVDKLLETILAIAEVNEYKANKNRYAQGTVIESKLDKSTGAITSLLIQNGTLRLGDPLVVGNIYGKVRTIKNDLGQSIVEAGPSTPVEITGLSSTPSAGDKFMAFETDKQAKDIAAKRSLKEKESGYRQNVVTLEDLFSKIQSGIKEINVILKTDVRGSEEAVREALLKIDVEGVKIKIVRSGVGAITETDVVLANASNAIIIGFNVATSSIIKDIAKEYGVDIRMYTIIYKLVEDMENAMKGMLDPEYEEKTTGYAEVRALFKFSKVGTIAGCMVKKGIIKNGSHVRLIRDGNIIYDGIIGSIQREKNSAKEVKEGFECGITIDGYNDIKEGDELEAYEMVEIKK